MFILFSALIGLIIGSFLNSLLFRIHADVPLSGRSKCLVCEEPISPYDLIPVVSYFLLRGRCRKCKAVISWQYPLIEATCALLFALLAFHLPGLSFYNLAFPEFLRLATFTTFLVIVFIYDVRYGYILDQFTLPGMMLALLFNMALGSVALSSMIFGAIAVGGIFALQFIVSKGKWIGDGDIRMGILMGLMLGLSSGLLALFLSYIIGAIFAVGLLIARKKKLQSHLPLGTFLAFGTFLVLLYGEQIMAILFSYTF